MVAAVEIKRRLPIHPPVINPVRAGADAAVADLRACRSSPVAAEVAEEAGVVEVVAEEAAEAADLAAACNKVRCSRLELISSGSLPGTRRSRRRLMCSTISGCARSSGFNQATGDIIGRPQSRLAGRTGPTPIARAGAS